MSISLEKPNPPILTYSSIKRGTSDYNYPLGSEIPVSTNTGYNKITITFSSNVQLNRYVINSVKGTDTLPDIEIGTRLVTYPNSKQPSLPANTNITASFDINTTLFNEGDGLYTIFMCAQSIIDYSWDITYLFTVKIAEGSSTYQGFSTKTSQGGSTYNDNTEVLVQTDEN